MYMTVDDIEKEISFIHIFIHFHLTIEMEIKK